MSGRCRSVRYHLAPPRGWLNDPNGMVRHEGRWHVFYQHNPHAPVHATIGWGHASSADLLTWRHHQMAFGPTPGGPDAHGCWSGTFLPGAGAPAVVYSGIADETLVSTVCLRWGSPDLETWGEPVVVATTPATDGIRVMRDPFVFSWSGRRYAVLGAGLEDGTPAVLLFDCQDPLAWRYLGIWLTSRSPALVGMPVADIWECPQVLDLAGGSL
ncbi:MAG: glycoside hydrolase family 32 protein, partial [Ornithinibacter sp.]